jgi:hypothetical protein
METFAKLFARFLVFVYHCFDRIVIQGYLPLLTRPEHIVHFFRDVGEGHSLAEACPTDKAEHDAPTGQASIPSPRRSWPSALWNTGGGWKATPATTRCR